MRKTFGFTITQLLVVISIIAVLVAILYPVTVVVKKKALVRVCASNLKQAGFACLMYAGENDQLLFPRLNFDLRNQTADYVEKDKRWVRAGDPVGWHNATLRYAKSTEVFFCPASSSKRDRSRVLLLESPKSKRIGLTSYLTSLKWWIRSKQTEGWSIVKIDQLAKPSNEVYLWEVYWLPEEYGEPKDPDGLQANIHGVKSNFFFLDGSVRTEDLNHSSDNLEPFQGEVSK